MRRPPGGDFFENIEPLFRRGPAPRRGGTWSPTAGFWRALVLLAIATVFFTVIRPAITLYTELVWFHQLGYGALLTTRLGYQFAVWLGAFGFGLLFLAGNATAALSLTASGSVAAIGTRRRRASPLGGGILASALLVAILMAGVLASGWETFARAIHATAFGVSDPVFHQDVGYYVFRVPLYNLLWGWLLGLVILAAALAAVVYFIRQTKRDRLVIPAGAVAHMSLLAALLFLLLGVHYRLAMLGLLSSSHGAVYGAGNTDLNLRLPVDWIMLGLSLLLAVALLANTFMRRPAVVVATLGAWVVLAIVLGGIVPAIYQGLVVKPAELTRDRDYIAREIDFTNRAYGLSDVEVRDFPDQAQVSTGLLAANAPTINNLRLWDYTELKDAYQQIQSFRTYYDFQDVGIDRYHLPGGYRQVMISARELNPANLQATAQTWVNLHLKYTHGYGVAATPVSSTGEGGQPALVVRDIPPTGDIPLTTPQIYFGEAATGYVVVDSREQEFDYQKGDLESFNRWQGDSGIHLSSGLDRLALAVRFADLNLLISSQIGPDSQLLFHRDIRDRIQTLAPFLQMDHDPYPVLSGGRMYWIADAYTTSADYPYSEPVDTPTMGALNYIRNSVKVVTDAYSGAVMMYVADPADPILRTYAAIFPGVFHPLSEMPADLRSHVRYPEDLFNIQSGKLANFHMHRPEDFYNKGDGWAIPTEVQTQGAAPVQLQAYYILMTLPGESQEEFVLIQPFTPNSKSNMVSWLAARSDGPQYGKLLNFRFPTGRQVAGPAQVESRIDAEPRISRDFSLLNQQGSRVLRGNLLVIPVGDSVLFVEPVFIQGTSGSAIPELQKVIVADDRAIGYGDSLAAALTDLTGQAAPSSAPSAPSSSTATLNLEQLAAEANAIYAQAQADLRAGDLRKYADDITQLGLVLQRMKSPGGGTSPTPAATPSPRR